uniref:Uncharacterized protein n=1 Tax=Panagrolaimus sp. JU765 TaxID=591449 RepID=A0AC34QHW3_9BILA
MPENEDEESWLDCIIASYEDFSQECSEWFEEHSLINLASIFCIFMLIYAPIILSEKPVAFYSLNYEADPNGKFNAFANEIKAVFPRDKALSTILMTFGEKIISQSTTATTGPDVLTLAVCNSCVAILNNSLRPALEKHLHYKVINLDVTENDKESEFYQKTMKSLSGVGGKAVVFINGIDKMKAKTPLVLQSISDENLANYKNAIFIFLVLDDKISRKTGLNCGKNIFSHLLEHWENPLLLEDQVYPIVSRVTRTTACYSV